MKHTMTRWIVPMLMGLVAVPVFAKLPTPTLDAAAQAKADEAKARTAWQAKVDAYQLCQAQDKVAAQYRKTAASKTAAAPGAATPAPAGGATPSTPAPTPVSTAAPAGAAGCADPGAFAYTPPEQKPLEASGAHSPPGTASSPPSTGQPAAATPEKK